DIFLGAGADGVDGGGGIGFHPAGHDGDGDALGLEPGDQPGNVHHHVHEQQVGALAGAQGGQADLDGGGMGNLGAAIHGHLGRGRELACQGADDEETHVLLPYWGLMISVMVTPSRFSTRTISPRATRRSLMKISTASPTCRSSSITVPVSSLSRAETGILVRPSTTDTRTGTSNTASRSAALRSIWASPRASRAAAAISSRLRPSAAMTSLSGS